MKRKAFISNKWNDKNDNLLLKNTTEYSNHAELIVSIVPFTLVCALYLELEANNLLSIPYLHHLKHLDRERKKHFNVEPIFAVRLNISWLHDGLLTNLPT